MLVVAGAFPFLLILYTDPVLSLLQRLLVGLYYVGWFFTIVIAQRGSDITLDHSTFIQQKHGILSVIAVLCYYYTRTVKKISRIVHT